MLYDSLSQLQTVQERFIINVSTITLLRKSDPESEALVPLTPSVYVSCRTHPESVLIDIGTGYYVKVSTPWPTLCLLTPATIEATLFLRRKISRTARRSSTARLRF